MKEIIEIPRPHRTTSKVCIGDVIQELDSYLPDNKIVVITDSNLHRLYRPLIEKYEYIVIGLGETNKTLLTIDEIYNQLIEMGVDRHSYIVGIGGGIVTDITGFVASTYMRGLGFGFVATSLLAQVDASVGGKNGCNVGGYKNMVGTFNQPDFVLCDTSMLSTLPEREVKAGISEIIKAGIIADKNLFEKFENTSFAELYSNKEILREVITDSVKVKARVVEMDEKEMGERKKLNLGHTFAHAVEKSTSDFLHGEAVAIGMVMASEVACGLGKLSKEDQERIIRSIKNMNLPTECSIDKRTLLKAMRSDKKKDQASIDVIIPCKIGHCEIIKMSFEELEKLFLEN
ncbi:MAG: 3-dehydroquinate synthase [Rikenellaceae bacterium]